MKKILIVLLALLIIIGAFVYFKKEVSHNSDGALLSPKNNIACTEEAKMCPDGTYVGRTGPNCEFAICPLPVVNNPDEVLGSGGTYACTMDAKMCPDGSYVGRTGPKCEFQACPSMKIPDDQIDNTPQLSHKINTTAVYNGIGITPLKIVEDSRCRKDVQCVWAGRLVVKVRLENTLGASSGSGIPGPAVKKYSEEVDLELGKARLFAGKNVTLTDGVGNTFSFEVK